MSAKKANCASAKIGEQGPARAWANGSDDHVRDRKPVP